MHPPDLNMLETNSGLRRSDGSFSGKAQATSSNITLDIFKQTNATAVIVDDDENLIRQVEAIEAAIGLNLEATEVGGSKDSGAAADAVCGVNLASENIHQHRCGEHILVERGKNKQANASGDDIGNVAGCAEMDVDKQKGMIMVLEKMKITTNMTATMIIITGMNLFENIVRQTKITISKDVHQKDDVVNGLIETVMNILYGGVVEVKGLENRRLVEANDQGLQMIKEIFYVPLESFTLQFAKECNSTRACDETHSGDSAVNVLVSPQKLYKTRHLNDTGESDDAVLVTPPKQYTKHNRVIEADDEFVNPPLTETAKVCNSTSACDEKLFDRESDDDVLITPPKQYNKHNRVIEADDEFVDPPVIQTTEFDGGESFTPGKHILSTFVFGDDDLFVDPPVTEGIGIQGGEAFMKGIQVSEMYGYDNVVPVFSDMEGSGFQPQDIEYSKEDSDIYAGRMFKDKAQFKLMMSIYALAKVCRFKFWHCKRFVTAKCVDKQCSWRVKAKQLGDSPTYVVKMAILGHVCTAEVRGQYKKHGTSRVLSALLRSKYERLQGGPRFGVFGLRFTDQGLDFMV
ncbi:LOW QUALITY PROTEIN: hypothetical protein HID58_034187 [Brassica napus]|uniref:Transposase MuDR plant domain-containing protein n=1 Tax=Brassica napus TaxID=3708 RepID=A0ABQ8C379_BRANA|nr:LOW QUALITY PROTEIN: hypothetical protein HID58_034187 [Brassica napus]